MWWEGGWLAGWWCCLGVASDVGGGDSGVGGGWC